MRRLQFLATAGTAPRAWVLTAALVLGALSLAPSYAHLLEAGPRLMVWSPVLWREVTVINLQYVLFEWVGGPIDIAAICTTAYLTLAVRGATPTFRLSLAAAVLYAMALALWFVVVLPADVVLSAWQTGPVPSDFAAVRNRWEGGHMAIAVIKLLAFFSLASAIVKLRAAPVGPFEEAER